MNFQLDNNLESTIPGIPTQIQNLLAQLHANGLSSISLPIVIWANTLDTGGRIYRDNADSICTRTERNSHIAQTNKILLENGLRPITENQPFCHRVRCATCPLSRGSIRQLYDQDQEAQIRNKRMIDLFSVNLIAISRGK
ncbi:hypothetical protein DV711_06220 [Motiliproteus coralliicola]|uniref:Uncharacterized protein n=1 Tax=Motiliproteus coralliicola TaxID=2283196 RepID=A0A369WSS7_9GAMM|nr:hypothetical protein [Motiliproteus coralliicola]RDE25148.1 hypothetical protein DV711_06220 [Motiliproteus coralliicola]